MTCEAGHILRTPALAAHRRGELEAGERGNGWNMLVPGDLAEADDRYPQRSHPSAPRLST
jgi:hypothetical protein